MRTVQITFPTLNKTRGPSVLEFPVPDGMSNAELIREWTQGWRVKMIVGHDNSNGLPALTPTVKVFP